MPSDKVIELCNSTETVVAALAADPKQDVLKVTENLFKNRKPGVVSNEDGRGKGQADGQQQESELDRAALCGKFPYRPSDLFLTVYNDVLSTLEHDPMANLCSPSLIASSGTMPLTIVSVIPDIMRHYAELITRARSEIFLATNYWENSHSASIICDALKELSKRVERRSGDNKVVVKIMYDRGTPSQVLNNHAVISEADWTKPEIGLPHKSEIPFLDLQVVNYHRPVLGTFHAKFMVIDREVACLNSNNIQDRPNVEMCAQLEGPIVEGFYDMALQSWGAVFEPPLPLINKPGGLDGGEGYKFQKDNERLGYIEEEHAGKFAHRLLQRHHGEHPEHEDQAQDQQQQGQQQQHGKPSAAQQVKHVGRKLAGHGGEQKAVGRDDAIGEHPAMTVPRQSQEGVNEQGDQGGRIAGEGQANGDGDVQNVYGATADGDRQTSNVNVTGATSASPNGPSPQVNSEANTGANTSVTSRADATQAIRDKEYADDTDITHSSGTGTTDSSSPNTNTDASTEINPNGTNPVQDAAHGHDHAGTQDPDAIKRVAEHLNAGNMSFDPTVQDAADMTDFRPHILHEPHKPFPIAMVNRRPKGTPGHEGVHKVPQNVAWLSALKNAKQKVFIQSPTFNASPVIPAVVDACKRDVQVILYLDLGFNDLGEMIPFQGGTNEAVVHKMYQELNAAGKQQNLKVYWYVSKDQTKPISATAKKRNCHVKFMSVDDQIAILGNGNQDTQSWFHSQEINVMIDCPQVVDELVRGINANQNTLKYGLVSDKDGVYRDGEGKVVESSGVKSQGVLASMKGFGGAIARVRGKGGF